MIQINKTEFMVRNKKREKQRLKIYLEKFKAVKKRGVQK